MRAGLKFWLFVAFVGGVWAAMQFGEEKPASGTAGPDPEAATPQAPAEPVAYALDTTRATWPPLEGANPAEASRTPGAVNYYVVLDGSGSMQKQQCSGNTSKMTAAIAAVTQFVASVPADHQLGLAVFDGGGLSERVPLAANNRAAMVEAVARVNASGGTPLRSAIELGFRQLTRQAQRQLGYGEYHLVVVTDGHPDPRSEDPEEIVERLLLESPVQLHTVGFCIGENHVLNQPGRVFYAAADSPDQLRQGLESVLAEAETFDVSRFSK